MRNLFDAPYLSKAYQPTDEEHEEAVEENKFVDLRKEKRRGQGYLRMHSRLAKGKV